MRRGGGGGGFAAQISSKVRPRIRGGGATRIAVPRGVVDLEVRSSSMSSVVEPQSVPSRISVVLVEEAKVRVTECLVSSRVDKDRRSLAGVASPASVTVCEGGKISPCVVGTLSPSDSDSVGPVGPYGTPSPSASDYVVLVNPGGTLSSSDLAGMMVQAVPAELPFPVGPVGPTGPVGTLPPCDSMT